MNEEIKDVETHEGRGREEENGKEEGRKGKKNKEKKRIKKGTPCLVLSCNSQRPMGAHCCN